MAGKMKIIIMVGIAVVGFGGSFFVSSWMGGDKATTTQPAGEQPEDGLDGVDSMLAQGQPVSIGLKEKELVALIKEVRLKNNNYKKKQKDLEARERRIRIAGETLKKQAEELEALRIQLVAPITHIKEAIAELESTRVSIAQTEKANIKHIAAVCEKMDTTSSSQMLTGMCKNNQEDDAVKILYYMSERSAGKLLSEITDKTLAAKLCGKLKTVQEKG